jgi:hypothetical protein
MPTRSPARHEAERLNVSCDGPSENDHLRDRAEQADQQRRSERSEEAVDIEAVEPPCGQQQHQGVDHEREQAEGHQRQRQRQQLEDPADHGVDQAEDRGNHEEREEAAVDVHAG